MSLHFWYYYILVTFRVQTAIEIGNLIVFETRSALIYITATASAILLRLFSAFNGILHFLADSVQLVQFQVFHDIHNLKVRTSFENIRRL